ncbi:hypothetical protein YT1_2502 [Rhodococcus ruber]|nr:hypothetical protein YT1_2502 [Rhodococcus ruber]
MAAAAHRSPVPASHGPSVRRRSSIETVRTGSGRSLPKTDTVGAYGSAGGVAVRGCRCRCPTGT